MGKLIVFPCTVCAGNLMATVKSSLNTSECLATICQSEKFAMNFMIVSDIVWN